MSDKHPDLEAYLMWCITCGKPDGDAGCRNHRVVCAPVGGWGSCACPTCRTVKDQGGPG